MEGTSRWALALWTIAVALAFTVGILIGRFAIVQRQDGLLLPGISEALISDGDPSIGQELMEDIRASNIEKYLQFLSEESHIAGSERNQYLAQYIHDFWLDQGLDDVTMAPYDVLLSFPDPRNPNQVRLVNSSGHAVYRSEPAEDILTPWENRSNVVPPFNAYSAPRNVTGDLVYVNYGRVEDYAWLENNTNINVSGKVVIVRYGKIFRGSKVDIATRHGAKAIILYSDPTDYAAGNDSRVYPHSWWLPPSGAQRGSLYHRLGDPLTPGYPAIGSAYRFKDTEVELPTIPCHPVGYGIAEKLLRPMTGTPAPPHWRGKLNVPYNLGPGFADSLAGGKIELKISTTNQRRLIYNVIGFIRGAVEPDRYVLMGNHRDAWVFGAMDPSSGTAVMMEAARAMGNLVKAGKWRPRRTIVFCSWGAEEYGLIGSNEFTEHYVKNLQSRAVAYFNVDVAVVGNHSLEAGATPLLYKALYNAAKKVPTPNSDDISQGHRTVYDKWAASSPQANSHLPRIDELGSGSDQASLLFKAGVPAISLGYSYDQAKLKIALYPLYHSVYETMYAVKNFIDPDFKVHRAVAQLTAETVRDLADSLILPFSLTDFASQLRVYYNSLMGSYGPQLRVHLPDIAPLDSAITNFTAAVNEFDGRLPRLDRYNPLLVRMVNDQLMLLNKAFLDPSGLPLRSYLKHLIFAESSNDAYAGSSFPGLADLLFEIDLKQDASERWEKVKHHFSVIVFTLQSAESTLREVTKFISNHL